MPQAHEARVDRENEDEAAVRAFVGRFSRVLRAPRPPVPRPVRRVGPEPYDPEKVKDVRLPYGDDKD